MSQENVRAYLQRIADDENFRSLIDEAFTDKQYQQIALLAGYYFTIKEWNEVVEEIGVPSYDEELNNTEFKFVAGETTSEYFTEFIEYNNSTDVVAKSHSINSKFYFLLKAIVGLALVVGLTNTRTKLVFEQVTESKFVASIEKNLPEDIVQLFKNPQNKSEIKPEIEVSEPLFASAFLPATPKKKLQIKPETKVTESSSYPGKLSLLPEIDTNTPALEIPDPAKYPIPEGNVAIPFSSYQLDANNFDPIIKSQFEEVRDYFEKNWQPPKQLRQTIEYHLTINSNGSILRITPIGKTSEVFIDRTNIPLMGEKFVSPLKDKSQAIVHLLLSPDGEVSAFLE